MEKGQRGGKAGGPGGGSQARAPYSAITKEKERNIA